MSGDGSTGAVTARSPGPEDAGGREEETGTGSKFLCILGTESNNDPLSGEASMLLPADGGDGTGEVLADVACWDWLTSDPSAAIPVASEVDLRCTAAAL